MKILEKLVLALIVIAAIPIALAWWIGIVIMGVVILLLFSVFFIWNWLTKSPVIVEQDGQRIGVMIRGKYIPDSE